MSTPSTAPGTNALQQRKDRRFKQWNKATLKVSAGRHDPAHPVLTEGFTYDLSLGGARIHSPMSFEVGARLSLNVELVRTKESVRIEGLVKWVRHNAGENIYEMGVEFLHSNPSTVMCLMKNLHEGPNGTRR